MVLFITTVEEFPQKSTCFHTQLLDLDFLWRRLGGYHAGSLTTIGLNFTIFFLFVRPRIIIAMSVFGMHPFIILGEGNPQIHGHFLKVRKKGSSMINY